jgi:2-iminobutanoate/2-iminopropanoate deaminase
MARCFTLNHIVLAATLSITVPGAALAADSGAGGVQVLQPVPGGITPSGSWSVGARAGDFVFIGGMRGVDPATGQLVEGDAERIRQMFRNMLAVAESAGAKPTDAVRLTIFVTDVARLRPIVNEVQKEFWGDGPYPPRTVLGASSLDQNDIAEVDGTFYAPVRP